MMINRVLTTFAVSSLVVALALPLAAQEEPASASLEVTELVLSKGVEGGTPVDPTERFTRADGRVFATIRLHICLRSG